MCWRTDLRPDRGSWEGKDHICLSSKSWTIVCPHLFCPAQRRHNLLFPHSSQSSTVPKSLMALLSVYFATEAAGHPSLLYPHCLEVLQSTHPSLSLGSTFPVSSISFFHCLSRQTSVPRSRGPGPSPRSDLLYPHGQDGCE